MLLREHIKYERDALLSPLAKATLADRYMLPTEKSPQELLMRAATAWGSNEAHSLRLYEYASLGWFGFSTPTLSNAPIRISYSLDAIKNFAKECFESVLGALPISCFTGHVGDNREEIGFHYYETLWLASGGGGFKSNWSDLRPIGSSTSTGSKTGGLIPFYHVTDGLIVATHQGNNRRGISGGAVSIGHMEIISFIESRKMSGDNNKRSRNVFQTVVIPDEFMYKVIRDEAWDLKDHNGVVKQTLQARYLWELLLSLPFEVGCPFIMWEDTANDTLPETQKAMGLRVRNPNICTEIVLPTDRYRTAVCCLASPNAQHYDEWKDHPHFISDLIEMLDNILEYFIQNAIYACTKDYDWDGLKATLYGSLKESGIDLTAEQLDKLAKDAVERNIMGYKKAVYSAKRERAVGLGMMGLDSYFMNHEIAYESNHALAITSDIFSNVKARAVETSLRLGKERGEAPDMVGTGRRNSHLLAIAPTATNADNVGCTSALEKRYENIYTKKTKSGTFEIVEPALLRLLEKYDQNTPKVRKSIMDAQGSVQHLDFLTDHEKMYMRTAFEVDQRWIIEHAAVAQRDVCQAISLNLFIRPNATRKYVNNLHLLMWKRGLKTRYYIRSKALHTADAFADDIELAQTINYEAPFEECVACQ